MNESLALEVIQRGLQVLVGDGQAIKARVPDVPAYPKTRGAYVQRVAAAVSGYLESSGAVTRWRNAMRRAVVEAFPAAFYRGYRDAGGEETEVDDERWLTARTNQELAFVDELFAALPALRGDVEAQAESAARAAGYSGTLDGLYSEGKVRGAGNVMLTFRRSKGAPTAKEPCAECRRYDGRRHSAKWWAARGLVARNGNPNFGCGRWDGHCFHELFTDDGKQYTR